MAAVLSSVWLATVGTTTAHATMDIHCTVMANHVNNLTPVTLAMEDAVRYVRMTEDRLSVTAI